VRTGQLIAGRYRLAEQVGSGGNGLVWRATDEELHRTVAVKHAVSAGGVRSTERIRLLRREARILARINHPHVVTVFDVVADDGEWWLVMEYFPAPDLAQHGTLPPEQVARIGAQLASALEAVHAAGIVHRDIKPGNVLMTDDDRAKLSDFGISRTVHGDVTVTDTGLVAGTPGYLAPEVAKGDDPTPASDVFSLGATLFAALEGVSPFGSTDNYLLLLRRAAEGDIATPGRDTALNPVLARLMHVNADKRPTAAQSRQLLDGVAAEVHDTPGFRRRWLAGRRLTLGSATLVVVLAAVISLAVGFPEGSNGQHTDPGSGSVLPPDSPVVGDPATADPCALTDAVALARFGDAVRDAEYGNFDRCDVIVKSSGGSEVDVKVEFNNPDQNGNPPGPIERVGQVGILREAPNGDLCDRTLFLADGYNVNITAQENGDGQVDLCAMADTATASAATVLSRGEIPRRTTPADATSLIHADACGLLNAAALAKFPGVDALHPEVGFSGWECRWRSTTSSDILLVRFDRNEPLTAADGRPTQFAGHTALVQPEGYGYDTCQVQVVQRQYTGINFSPKVELLLVVIEGSEPADQLCGLATSLAEPAAAALPPR
jgi:hypothetical protein